MSPAETALLSQALVGAAVVFVVAYIGNLLSFSNRFVNALVTAIVFAAIYAGIYFAVDRAVLPPEVRNLSQEAWIKMIAIAAGLVFVIDLVGNMLSFSNRFLNALVTALVFAALFGGLMYATGGVPTSIKLPA